jgi:hypothetical protein
MTDYLAKARQHVRDHYGDDFSVLEASIVDSERFYCFNFQSNAFIQTQDMMTMVVGQGDTIINKEDNRFFNFGSRFSLAASLKMLEENLLTEKRIRKHKPRFELNTKYNLQINGIKKRHVLIEQLILHEVTYVIPEVVGDSIFRVAKTYDTRSLEKRLNDVPVVFHGVSDSLALVDALLASDCCNFELEQHQDRAFAKYVDRATDEDLQAIW